MQPVNQQKAILIVAVIAVVALLATTFFSNPAIFNFSEERKQAIQQEQEAIRQTAKFAADSGVDEEASRLFWKQVLDPTKMKKQVEQELGVNIPYKAPVVEFEKIKVVGDSSLQAFEEYIDKTSSSIKLYRDTTEEVLPTASGYDADLLSSYTLSMNSEALVNELYSIEVPEGVVELHKGILSGFIAQRDYAKNNDLALRNLLPRGTQWTATANTFIAFTESTNKTEAEAGKVAGLMKSKYAEEKQDMLKVKTAHALIPTETVLDLPREIREILQAVTSMFVTNYVKNQVLKYVEETEKQFLITNYLYYTDALVDQKYANSFLDKYVEDPEQRQIIKQLLPQFSCGKVNEDAIRKKLRDQALSYLGYDPTTLSPTDPDLYKKIFEASIPESTGASINTDAALLFNKSIAIVTEAQAQRAANQELIAPGKKVPVTNDQKKNIQVSLDYLTGKLNSAIKTIFDLVLPASATTGKGALAGVVVSAVGQIIQQFGVANAVVIKEQETCIGGGAGVFTPIIPPNAGSADINISDDYVKQCVSNPSACGLIISQVGHSRWVI